VVEVKVVLANLSNSRFRASELELLNKVLVSSLGESAALLGIKVDVVNEKLGLLHRKALHVVVLEALVGNNELLNASKVNVKAHLVVLKSNKRKCKTNMAVEPKLERNEKSVLRLAVTVVCSELGNITNHLVITAVTITSMVGKLIPDLEPGTILLVNLGTTNLYLNVVKKSVSKATNPSELGTSRWGHLRKSDLDVHVRDKITIAGNASGGSASKVRVSIESELDTLHGEVGVTAVHHLEECNLRVTRKINILGTVSDKLHKTSSHFLLIYILSKQNNLSKIYLINSLMKL